eukprot:TRINITY_DN2033_c0_g1_i1.p1 TRINITY_DN2033_c0_g1~~TRINITY_DN2033_c0_g1_i1.p1  ORF type:complete len:813 (-),score=156.60 TRINITY_DN2033_c0_g1_i1:120-2558(-)
MGLFSNKKKREKEEREREELRQRELELARQQVDLEKQRAEIEIMRLKAEMAQMQQSQVAQQPAHQPSEPETEGKSRPVSTNDMSEQLTCCVCMDIFDDPVINSCGHNVCRKHISKLHGQCPTCRKSWDSDTSNYSLKDIIRTFNAGDLAESPSAAQQERQPARVVASISEAPFQPSSGWNDETDELPGKLEDMSDAPLTEDEKHDGQKLLVTRLLFSKVANKDPEHLLPEILSTWNEIEGRESRDKFFLFLDQTKAMSTDDASVRIMNILGFPQEINRLLGLFNRKEDRMIINGLLFALGNMMTATPERQDSDVLKAGLLSNVVKALENNINDTDIFEYSVGIASNVKGNLLAALFMGSDESFFKVVIKGFKLHHCNEGASSRAVRLLAGFFAKFGKGDGLVDGPVRQFLASEENLKFYSDFLLEHHHYPTHTECMIDFLHHLSSSDSVSRNFARSVVPETACRLLVREMRRPNVNVDFFPGCLGVLLHAGRANASALFSLDVPEKIFKFMQAAHTQFPSTTRNKSGFSDLISNCCLAVKAYLVNYSNPKLIPSEAFAALRDVMDYSPEPVLNILMVIMVSDRLDYLWESATGVNLLNKLKRTYCANKDLADKSEQLQMIIPLFARKNKVHCESLIASEIMNIPQVYPNGDSGCQFWGAVSTKDVLMDWIFRNHNIYDLIFNAYEKSSKSEESLHGACVGMHNLSTNSGFAERVTPSVINTFLSMYEIHSPSTRCLECVIFFLRNVKNEKRSVITNEVKQKVAKFYENSQPNPNCRRFYAQFKDDNDDDSDDDAEVNQLLRALFISAALHAS